MLQLNQAAMVLALRVGLIALLYLFLAIVMLAVRREMAAVARATSASGRAGATATGASGPASAALVVVSPGPTALVQGHRFVLRNPTLIGRGSTNDIDLEDEFVSHRHVRLLLLDNVWHAEDLGTTNGTRLREAALRGTGALAPGDALGVGRVELRFEVGS